MLSSASHRASTKWTCTDQSQEWLGCIGKNRGGILGVTEITSALIKWAVCQYPISTYQQCQSYTCSSAVQVTMTVSTTKQHKTEWSWIQTIKMRCSLSHRYVASSHQTCLRDCKTSPTPTIMNVQVAFCQLANKRIWWWQRPCYLIHWRWSLDRAAQKGPDQLIRVAKIFAGGALYCCLKCWRFFLIVVNLLTL